MFEPTSRYAGVDDARLTVLGPDGTARAIVYKRRRFLPPAQRTPSLAEHAVTDGERLDHVAARYLGDPTQFWRLCDANGAMHPADLEAVGRVVTVAMPEL